MKIRKIGEMCEILAAALIKHLSGTEKCEIEGQARDYGTKILLKHTPISEHLSGMQRMVKSLAEGTEKQANALHFLC